MDIFIIIAIALLTSVAVTSTVLFVGARLFINMLKETKGLPEPQVISEGPPTRSVAEILMDPPKLKLVGSDTPKERTFLSADERFDRLLRAGIINEYGDLIGTSITSTDDEGKTPSLLRLTVKDQGNGEEE